MIEPSQFVKGVLLRVARFLLPPLTVSIVVLAVLRTSVSDWHDVWIALQALWQGAFGTTYDVGNTLNKTPPLILTGLGVAVAFRARMWNIGGGVRDVVCGHDAAGRPWQSVRLGVA